MSPLEPVEPSRAIEIFYSYAHNDEQLLNKLKKHLTTLRIQGRIASWYDREIGPGAQWKENIDKHLNSADIVLLLISPDFIASPYCREEAAKAMKRHKSGDARVIPIILSPCDWKNLPIGERRVGERQDVLGDLQALPRDSWPIVKWEDRDEAFLNVVEGIRHAIEELNAKFVEREIDRTQTSPSSPSKTKEQWLDDGYVAYEGKHYEQALDAFHQALQLDPHYPLAHYNKGYGGPKSQDRKGPNLR